MDRLKISDVELISLVFDVSKSEAKRLAKDCTLGTPFREPVKGWKSIDCDVDGEHCHLIDLHVGKRRAKVYLDDKVIGIVVDMRDGKMDVEVRGKLVPCNS